MERLRARLALLRGPRADARLPDRETPDERRHEQLLERAIAKAAERLAQREHAAPGRRAELEAQLAAVDLRLQRGLDALLSGTEASVELQARLKAATPGTRTGPVRVPVPALQFTANFQ